MSQDDTKDTNDATVINGKSNQSFENAYSSLEDIVKRMEQGEQDLEGSLKDFEQGIQLIKQCHEYLQQAEQRIQTIQQNEDGAISGQPFDNEK